MSSHYKNCLMLKIKYYYIFLCICVIGVMLMGISQNVSPKVFSIFLASSYAILKRKSDWKP